MALACYTLLYMKTLKGVVANELDYDTGVKDFELKSRYYVHFRTDIFC